MRQPKMNETRCIAFCLLSVCAVPAPGQQLSNASALIGGQFKSALENFARKRNLVVVAEGSPRAIRQTQTSDARADDANAELSRLCEIFDYDAASTGRIIVLAKRYSDPRDLPDITAAEYMASLAAASRLLDQFDPQIPPPTPDSSPYAVGIGRSLTAEQASILAGPGLPVAQLRPEQRTEIARLASFFYVQNYAVAIRDQNGLLTSVLKQNPVFGRKTVAGINTLGFEVAPHAPRQPIFISYGNTDQVAVDADGGITTFNRERRTVNGVPVDEPASDEKHQENTSELAGVPRSQSAQTLGQVIASLNARSIDDVKYQVDTDIEKKSVTIANASAASPDDLFGALVAASGLRMTQPNKHTRLLTIPATPHASTLLELGAALRAVIPPPLYRAIQARMKACIANPSQRGFRDLEDTCVAAASDIGMNARKALIPRLESLIKQDRKIRFSELSENERVLFVQSLCCSSLGTVVWLGVRPMPFWLSDLDSVILTGALTQGEDGRELLTLFFGKQDPSTGHVSRNAGFINGRIPSSH